MKILSAAILMGAWAMLPAQAKVAYALYQHSGSKNGYCMAPPSGDPQAVLNRNGIKTSGNPRKAELKALAKGISQIERLNGGPMPNKWKTTYNFINAGGAWNQGASSINVRRPSGSDKGENVTRMMHELGHKVGNSGAYGDYNSYTKGKSCGLTHYCKNRARGRNEEFAEVFAAYVVNPDLLKKNCPESYNFFNRRLFKAGETAQASCSSPTQLAQKEDPAPQQEPVAETKPAAAPPTPAPAPRQPSATVRPPKPTAARPRKQPTARPRHTSNGDAEVQRLFTHPLGDR